MALTTPYDALLARFPERAVLVLGDLMVDEYIWGHVSRISPEAPVPVVEVKAETVRLGGAANVAANLRALGGRVQIVGLVGNDAQAERLAHELEALGVKSDGVVVDRDRPTTIKTRVVAGSQHVVRFDRESDEPVGAEAAARIAEYVRRHLPAVDAVCISDYAKGVVTEALLGEVLPAARAAGRIVAVDPKVAHFFHYRGVDVITPNHHEAAAAAGVALRREADLRREAERLRRAVAARALLVTRGEHGMSLFEGDGQVTDIPTRAREVYDVTGAGDTVIAALSLALAAGATLREAAHIANYAAGVVVGKVGTATVSLTELRRAIAEAEGPEAGR
jgi:D-beta-D-heptose 7-phosphate kinase/D-beta-D-heptose 1-phosphate adenosyltransferase